jgi:hypothetical protein
MPKKMIAAGTQATDGSDCRPLTSGPMPRRTACTRAMSSPSGVPIAEGGQEPEAAAGQAHAHRLEQRAVAQLLEQRQPDVGRRRQA